MSLDELYVLGLCALMCVYIAWDPARYLASFGITWCSGCGRGRAEGQPCEGDR